MKLVTQIEIDRPLSEVMALMADPANNAKWMADLQSYEPPKDGSGARLSFKNGMIFTASPLPGESNELRSKLEGKNLTIITSAYFKRTSDQKTELNFEQEFTFKGVGKILAFIIRPAIHKQQQKHMQDFKYFAQNQRD